MLIFLLELGIIGLLLWFFWKNLPTEKKVPLDEEKDAAEVAEELNKQRRILAAKQSEAKSVEELKEIEDQIRGLEKGNR